MSDSFNPNDLGNEPVSPAEAVRPGFDSLEDVGVVEPGIRKIDEDLAWFLNDNPGESRWHCLAVSTDTIWTGLRKGSVGNVPEMKISRRSDSIRVRFSYLSQAPKHGLEIVVYPDGLIDYKLVLNGRIQAYERAAPPQEIRIASILARYVRGTQPASPSRPALKYAGPVHSPNKPSYAEVSDGLGIEAMYGSCCQRWDPGDPESDMHTGLCLFTSYCNPRLGGTPDLYSQAKRALEVWRTFFVWSYANEEPVGMVNSQAEAYFGYRKWFNRYCFEVLIKTDSISWCLLLDSQVVSFDAAGEVSDLFARMNRFALTAYGVPFVPELLLEKQSA